MAPTGQGGQWQDVLCCSLCGQKFEQSFPPISLICGHVICRKCARLSPSQKKPCPNDDWKPTISLQKYPTNVALLSIVMPNDNCMNFSDARTDEERSIDQSMLDIAKYFKRAESERGGSVYSQKLSRTLQRKVFSLICHQWIENEGRIKCIKACKTIAERVMTEMLLSIQSNTHVSSLLWSAVRARGCQFLGPAMQEDVLRLILMTLENGEKIARKNLVMYVVTTLMQDYPQVSKTCVGHVVQLLYRASCFNVIKREEASSLMQLKEDFRTYEALRREHDSQIVQIAFESGLRIGPDQWSALLYADQGHRSHMQSIIDKLQSPNSYSQCLDELNALLSPNNSTLTMQTRILINQMQPVLEAFSDVTAENPTSAELADYLKKLLLLLNLYTENEEMKKSGVTGTSGYNTETDRKFVPAKTTTSRFKTKMCANIESNRHCERGIYCSFAHSLEELRNHRNGGQPMTLGQPAPPPTVPQAINVQISPQMMMQNGSRMQYMARVPPPAPSQSYQFYAHHPHHHQQMRKAAPSTQQSHSHHSMPPPQPGQIMIYPRDERRPQEMIENGNSQIQQISQQMQQQQSSQQQQPMMIVQSPTHLPPPPPGSMVMIPPQQTPLVLTNQPPPVAIGTPSIPPPNTIWAAPSPTGPQGSMIFPGAATSPGQHPHAIWIQPTQASIFPIESYEFGLGGGMIWGAATTLRESGGDADQLLAKRYEILKRLEPPISIDDDDCEDGGIGHVSYTVASSVLDDSRMEGHHPMILGLTPVQGIDLPPIPVSFATVPTEETMTIIGDLVQQTGRPRASSLTQSAPMLTANGQVVQQHEQQVVGQDVTTVQSECGTMNVMDSLCQPIVTSVIHNSNSPTVVPIATVVTALPPPPVSEATKFVPNVPPPPPGQTMLVDGTTGLLTPMIRPIIVPHPQNVVSSSLDKIMDVKERMSEAQGNVSEAENAHLRMELRMAECEMAHLDPFTKNNCLLLELQQVDRELQQLQIDQPTRAQ